MFFVCLPVLCPLPGNIPKGRGANMPGTWNVCMETCLVHSMCSINICGMSEWKALRNV